jgi:hypothetical protein
MTLLLNTLLSLHLSEFAVDQELVRQLEHSEKTKNGYSQNAGAAQEDGRHPSELLACFNLFIARDFADRLLSTQENSEIVQAQLLVQSNGRAGKVKRFKPSTSHSIFDRVEGRTATG